jgi:inner membrane transporter RhtA
LAFDLFPVYGPIGVLFLRMAIGSALLCLFYRAEIVGALHKAPLGILLLGLTMVAQSGAFYEAIYRIPLGITVSIEFLGPLGVAFATSRRPADILCVLVAGAGVLMLTPKIGTSLDLVGVCYAVIAAAAWACFILTSRSLSRSIPGGVGLAMAMAVSSILLLPAVGVGTLRDVAFHPETLVTIFGVALFSAAIPSLFEYLALKSMPAKKYGVLISLEPVVATMIGFVLLSESLDFHAGIAILLISTASIVTALLSRPGRLAD